MFGDGPGLLHDLKVWVVDGSRSPRIRGEALVDLEIPPAMGCIKAQADGIAVRRLPFRTLVSSGSNKTKQKQPPAEVRSWGQR